MPENHDGIAYYLPCISRERATRIYIKTGRMIDIGLPLICAVICLTIYPVTHQRGSDEFPTAQLSENERGE
jgi:hypothetical protein